jgi:indole-3-glycerol phosphate synthase
METEMSTQRISKPDILAKIEVYKRQEILLAKQKTSVEAMRKLARQAPTPWGFAAAIESHLSSGRPALIAEIKKASPSKGLIRPDFDPPALARAYVEGGASCLSVLTDEPSFQGHLDYLRLARDASGLARVCGADCVLIIMASVNDAEARELVHAAHDLGMDVLVEVHNKQELERALPLETKLVGINNRDLRTFEVSLGTTEELAAQIPKGRVIVSESGISNHADILRLSASGARTFLVGESLMRKQDVAAATQALLFDSSNPL